MARKNFNIEITFPLKSFKVTQSEIFLPLTTFQAQQKVKTHQAFIKADEF